VNSQYWIHKNLPHLITSLQFVKSFPFQVGNIKPIYKFDYWVNFLNLSVNLDCPIASKRNEILLPNSIINMDFNEFIMDHYPDHICIYTDASKTAESDGSAVGIAFYSPKILNFRKK
jgi:hypothetical protein